jgi:hypothetical protein
MTELERVDQAAEYFRRYEQKEAAIKQNRENQEYLKTYIHGEDYVEKNFNIKEKIAKGVGASVAAGIVLFLLLFIIFRSVLVGAVLGGFLLIGGSVFFISLQHYRFTAAKQHQVEVNEGITEQIEILKAREPQLIQDKDNFYKGLKERITFMSPDDRKYVGEIRKMIESGEAETAEDASAMLEQKMLLEQFNTIMEQNEIKIYTDEENKERFGDPLELIKKKRKPLFGFLKKKK